MKPIRPALALCAATAAVFGGFAYGEALPPKSQERLPVASLTRPTEPLAHETLAALPEPPAARPAVAEATPGQYRIAVSRVTSPAPLISQTAPVLASAAFTPPPAGEAAAEEAGAPPPRRADFRRPPPPPPGHGPDAGHFPPPPPPPPGPLDIAAMLAAQEIALGIRSDQLDAWRAYAAAVVDMVPSDPPAPPDTSKTPEPFGLSQALAARAVADGKKAQAVLDTRAALVAVLTPPQLEKASMLADQRPCPPPAMHEPMPGGMGHPMPHGAPDARP